MTQILVCAYIYNVLLCCLGCVNLAPVEKADQDTELAEITDTCCWYYYNSLTFTFCPLKQKHAPPLGCYAGGMPSSSPPSDSSPPLSPARGARSSGETSGRQTNRMPFGRHACIARRTADGDRASGWPRNCLNERPSARLAAGLDQQRNATPPSALRKLNDTGGGIAPACFPFTPSKMGRLRSVYYRWGQFCVCTLIASTYTYWRQVNLDDHQTCHQPLKAWRLEWIWPRGRLFRLFKVMSVAEAMALKLAAFWAPRCHRVCHR